MRSEEDKEVWRVSEEVGKELGISPDEVTWWDQMRDLRFKEAKKRLGLVENKNVWREEVKLGKSVKSVKLGKFVNPVILF